MCLKPVIHFTVSSAHTNDGFLHSDCLFLDVRVGNNATTDLLLKEQSA